MNLTIDHINSFFPFVGCIFVILNIVKLIKDKEVKGIEWFSPLFFYTGQAVGVIMMFKLEQWFSFIGGSILLFFNLVWWVLMMYYNFHFRKQQVEET